MNFRCSVGTACSSVGTAIRGDGVAVSPDGNYLAVALLDLAEALIVTPVPAPLGITSSDLRICSLRDGSELVSIPIGDLSIASSYLRGVDLSFSPDSARLTVAGNRLRIYRLRDFDRSPRSLSAREQTRCH